MDVGMGLLGYRYGLLQKTPGLPVKFPNLDYYRLLGHSGHSIYPGRMGPPHPPAHLYQHVTSTPPASPSASASASASRSWFAPCTYRSRPAIASDPPSASAMLACHITWYLTRIYRFWFYSLYLLPCILAHTCRRILILSSLNPLLGMYHVEISIT